MYHGPAVHVALGISIGQSNRHTSCHDSHDQPLTYSKTVITLLGPPHSQKEGERGRMRMKVRETQSRNGGEAQREENGEQWNGDTWLRLWCKYFIYTAVNQTAQLSTFHSSYICVKQCTLTMPYLQCDQP
jgi:hypothetical protein